MRRYLCVTSSVWFRGFSNEVNQLKAALVGQAKRQAELEHKEEQLEKELGKANSNVATLDSELAGTKQVQWCGVV